MIDKMAASCTALFWFCLFINILSFTVTSDDIQRWSKAAHRNVIAAKNLAATRGGLGLQHSTHVPGTPARNFSMQTLSGEIEFPGSVLNRSTPVLFFSLQSESGFCRCLFSCQDSVADLLLNSPNDAHYVFSLWKKVWGTEGEEREVGWNILEMEKMVRKELQDLVAKHKISIETSKSLSSRLHFAVHPTESLTKWIPDLLTEWRCEDHNCGIDSLFISLTDNSSSSFNVTSMRLDARYDWLPSPLFTLGSAYLRAAYVSNPCMKPSVVKGTIAIATYDAKCSYATMVSSLERAGAVGVLVMQKDFPVDMNCVAAECAQQPPLAIPASNIPHRPDIEKWTGNITIQFRNQASPNFFFAIDHLGNIAEAGWFLYPTMHFLAWQAQWFTYRSSLEQRLSQPSFNLKVFQDVSMNGSAGFTANITIPKNVRNFNEMRLDFTLSCFGSKDVDCPHWDRTLQLHVCCDLTSVLCGVELGRWISPFRRRIGRWLTSASAFIPLIASDSNQTCSFHLSGILNGEVWKPSLNLRLSQSRGKDMQPHSIKMLYNGSHTFDLKYNQHFPNLTLTFPPNITKVELVSVITGHGSDENGCGEFCVTSHHFTVNGRTFSRTFNNAGSPLGCASLVRSGVEPNEHGTWLYGRNGWCDGQQVDPWVISITDDLDLHSTNTIGYHGWFNGTDPNPHHNPGIIIIYSYLVTYTKS